MVIPPVQGGTRVTTPGQDRTVVSPTASNEAVTTTVTGGQLPKTSTSMYRVLLSGTVLTLIGAIGWRRRKAL